MADYVKQLDDNHLLTVGLDGFYGPGGRSWINPKGAGQWSEQVTSSTVLFCTPHTESCYVVLCRLCFSCSGLHSHVLTSSESQIIIKNWTSALQ